MSFFDRPNQHTLNSLLFQEKTSGNAGVGADTPKVSGDDATKKLIRGIKDIGGTVEAFNSLNEKNLADSDNTPEKKKVALANKKVIDQASAEISKVEQIASKKPDKSQSLTQEPEEASPSPRSPRHGT